MGFSSTKNVCEIMNLLLYFDSILSNYRRMGVKRQIYIVYKHTDIFKTWTVSGDATSILRASLPISGSTTTPTPRALLQVHRPEEKKIKIPPRWPFRINQFLNGHRGGFSFFSFFRSGGLQECSPSQ